MVGKPALSLVLPMVAAALLAGCGSSGSGSSGSGSGGSGSLKFVAFDPFSGPDASFGPEVYAGCPAAAKAINAAGGVLNHRQIVCQTSDSRGDPADAVPAAGQVLASTSNLVGILGPTSDEASATVPLFERSHIPMWPSTGQTAFNTNRAKYFWRITPPDDAVGYAVALFAYQSGYRHVAAVFGNDISAQGAAPAIAKAFRRLGGTLTTQSVALGLSSYRTEISQLAASKPEAILIEADPQTSATYLGEVSQLYHSVPIIGTDGTIQPPWQKAVSGALGRTVFDRFYAGAQPFAPSTGPAHVSWIAQLHLAAKSVQSPASQWDNDPYAEADWDAVNVSALAMELAQSANPVVFNRYIRVVTTGTPGAVVVHDFIHGKRALLAKKPIKYVGATGPIAFDQYQNSPGGFEVVKADGTLLKTYSSAQLQQLRQ